MRGQETTFGEMRKRAFGKRFSCFLKTRGAVKLPRMKPQLLAALCLATFAAHAADFTPEPGFIPLFNGKDLTGWGYGAAEKFDGKPRRFERLAIRVTRYENGFAPDNDAARKGQRDHKSVP